MAHWAENYIGQPYVLGESDCGHTAAQILREVFGKTIPPRAAIEREISRLGRVQQMTDVVGAFCTPVKTPEEGDLVLMLCRGRPSHIRYRRQSPKKHWRAIATRLQRVPC